MKYLFLIGSGDKNEPAMTPAESQKILQGHVRFGEELHAAGKTVVGERLKPEGDAARVRLKGDRRHITDGPFAETKEALGGFYMFDCASKDEALEWAKKIPLREGGFVEVRPIWQM
jgi:hypothetical protein